ncbi:MAG: AAA family ATPase, partial [Actinomycetota bacterium]
MRLHAMEFCGIGPFRGPQSIDFDGLTASGLFLIEGPTGSGKTTIIDAIVFALYGSLSGAESDAGRLRSHLCGPDEPTEVTLAFSVNGVRHTITRNPAYERLKARGSGTTSERARQTLVVHDDATPPMREAKEIGVYLQQRLGLSVEQFRRLVVLPQGEFDALLRAKPTDRYRTLASLIDDRMLERVQDELKRSADEAAQSRSDAIARVEKAVTMGRQRASEVLDPESVVEADLDTLVASLEAEVSDAAVHVAALISVLNAARQSDVTAQGSLGSARAAAEARQAIARAGEALDPRDAALDDTGLRSRDAEMVAQRTRLEPLAEWEAQGDQRECEGEIARATVTQLADALETTRAQAQALPEQVRALEAELAQA